MLSARQIRYTRHVLVLVGLCLAIYYLLFYKPLARRAADLDRPLSEVWKQLTVTRLKSPGHRINLAQVEDHLEKTRHSLERLTQAGQTIAAWTAIEPEMRAKLSEPFQFVDFQIEQQFRMEELTRVAQQNNVALGSSVFANFPEYTADQAQPNLLWLQLVFLDELLNTAVACKVSQIKSVELPAVIPHALATNEEAFLFEVPLRVEIFGSMASVSRLMACLPLRHDQAKALHLPPLRADKPSFFVHRFILKKSSAEDPEQVQLDLRASGFFYRE